MQFEPVKIENFKFYKQTKLFRVLQEFADADIPVAQLKWTNDEYKNHHSVQSSIAGSIKRYKMQNISVKCIDKKVYLINDLLFEKAVNMEV